MDKEFVAWLKRARALVAKGWTQNAFARDDTGFEVLLGSGEAVCWCAGGAMRATATVPYKSFVKSAKFDGQHITRLYRWNDVSGRTQSEVLAMFDNSIRALEEA